MEFFVDLFQLDALFYQFKLEKKARGKMLIRLAKGIFSGVAFVNHSSVKKKKERQEKNNDRSLSPSFSRFRFSLLLCTLTLSFTLYFVP